jgi:hypothetical protein
MHEVIITATCSSIAHARGLTDEEDRVLAGVMMSIGQIIFEAHPDVC